MKKTYETPNVEVVKFQYRDQVVVASGTTGKLPSQYGNWGYNGTCDSIEQVRVGTSDDCFKNA